MRGIRKEFPGVVALDGVDLEVRPGEVHVLLGENGAGKSTLMKVLSGAHRMDAGTIELRGAPVAIAGPRHAQALGVGIVYQEPNLVPQLSAADNVFLGRERRTRLGLVDRRRQGRETRELLQGLGVAIDTDAPVRRLGIAQRQMVEVAKALSQDARVLVMDEPTSALTGSEIAALFESVLRLTARGVAIVYISHRMEEVERIGQRVTVLRDGRNVASLEVGAVGVAELIRLMANREVSAQVGRRRTPPGPELLRVERLTRAPAFHDVGFVLRRGEVLGVAGLLGAGRSELARALAGADAVDSGRIVIKGEDARLRGPRDAIRRGVGLLPEDRKSQGLVLGLSVARNLALPSTPRLCRLGVVDPAAEAALGRRQVDQLRVKTPSLAQRVALLSGGNQQKVVLGKWLAADVDVLLMDEPTRGVDVGARQEIYELVNRLTAAGAGVLLISSELPELLAMSDRILVLHRGRVAAELDAREATQERVLSAALGRAC
jgi:ribose transport system ATP-binding protein